MNDLQNLINYLGSSNSLAPTRGIQSSQLSVTQLQVTGPDQEMGHVQ